MTSTHKVQLPSNQAMGSLIKVTRQQRVASIELNRPQVLNAINSQMMTELIDVVVHLDSDPGVGCIIFKGNTKAFSAGADIGELAQKSWQQMLETDHFSQWQLLNNTRTPKIAAIQGYALGGGCELAMMCDMLIASKSAKFSQPELNLGLIPGMGATQRLTRLVGRAVAMDLILTGRMIDAQEALSIGLVSRVIDEQQFESEVIDIAHHISRFSKIATNLACESIKCSDQMNLDQGLLVERRNYHALWNTVEKEIGTQAFLNKQKADFHPHL